MHTLRRLLGLVRKNPSESFLDLPPKSGSSGYSSQWVLGWRSSREFKHPVRHSYFHNSCGSITTVSEEVAETFAIRPSFYCTAYCTACRGEFQVSEFYWIVDRRTVGK